MNNIPAELFRRLDVALANAENGGSWWRGFPREHNNNRQVCLRFLKTMEIFHDDDTLFSWISDDLTRDKAFMLEALKVSPSLSAENICGVFHKIRSTSKYCSLSPGLTLLFADSVMLCKTQICMTDSDLLLVR